jgi:hypothetical protein
MLNETFRTITFSDETKFIQTGGKIQLREYKDNLTFYTSFDATIDATYYSGDSVAVPTSTDWELVNFGTFSQSVKTATSIKYCADNFTTLADEGTIQFRVRTDFANGFGYQEFVRATVGAIIAGDYSFYLSVDSGAPELITITLTGTEDSTDVFNAIAIAVTPSTGANVTLVSDKIRITSIGECESILISEGEDLSVIDLLGGLEDPVIYNPPSVNTTLLQIKNATNNNNRIDLIHTTDGNLVLKMYNNTGTLVVDKDFSIWNISNLYYYAVELSWNKTFAQVFINGNLLDMTPTGFIRGVAGPLYISGSTGNYYYFDELIVYNKHINFIEYTPAIAALTHYDTSIPYADVDFGTGLNQDTLSSIAITCSSNCHFAVRLGTQFYYYLGSVWVFSNGTFSQSMTKVVFEENITSLYLNENLSFSIRIFFESDGSTPCYIDDISIAQDSNVALPAKVIGVMSLQYPVDLSTGNDKFIIQTDVGSKEVSVITHCVNPAALTLEEVKAAIDAAGVPGLKPASDDGSYHIVLETISTGETAYLAVRRV